jgi:hypothetical protein
VPSSIVELPTYLRIELGGSPATETMALYREAAVRCVQKGLARVLIVALDGDPQIHQQLRSTIRAMALAECPAGLKFALVARHPATAAIYRAASEMAQELGLDVQAFSNEDDALRWLHAGS